MTLQRTVAIVLAGLAWFGIAETGLGRDALAQTPRVGCDLFGDKDDTEGLAADRIQAGPRAVYTAPEAAARGIGNFESALFDSFVGPQTIRALEAFCDDFPVDRDGAGRLDAQAKEDAVLAASSHFGSLSRAFAAADALDEDGRPTRGPARYRWRDVMASDAFAQFLAAGSNGPGFTNQRMLRLAGTHRIVTRLLQEHAEGALGTNSPQLCSGTGRAFDRLSESDQQRALNVLDILLAQSAGVAASDPASAVVAFCQAFPINPQITGTGNPLDSDLAKALLHYVAIHDDNPRWLATLSNPRYLAWALDEPEEVRGIPPLPRSRLLRTAGTVANSTAVLRDFPATPAPVEPTLGACADLQGWHYYELTPADLDVLGAQGDRSQGLIELYGSYPDAEAAIAALEGQVGDLDPCSTIRAREILSAQQPTVVWRLKPNAMASLVIDLPPFLRDPVAQFEGAASRTKDLFMGAVMEAVTDATTVEREAQAEVYALLAAAAVSEEAAAKAAADGTGASAPAEPSTDAQSTAAPSGDPGPPPQDTAPRAPGDPISLAAAASAATPAPADAGDAASADGEGQTSAKDVDRAIIRLKQEEPEGQLPVTEPVLRALADQNVPADAIVALQTLVDREPPFDDLGALQEEVKFLITDALAADPRYDPETYRTVIEAQVVPEGTVVIGPAVVEQLRQLPAFRSVDQTVVERIGPLLNVAFPEEDLFAEAAQFPTNDQIWHANNNALDEATVEVLVDRARKAPAEITQRRLPPVSDECACQTVDDNTVVYAFYPFWLPELMDPEKPNGIDLSVVSHLAYFGVHLHGDNVIAERHHWTEDGGAGHFIATARRYNVQPDLAVYLSDWEVWGQTNENITKAATEILNATEEKLNLDVKSFLGLRFFDRYYPRKVQGVTLYFDDFADAFLQYGVRATDPIKQMVASLYAILPAEIEINIAFEMPVSVQKAADRIGNQALTSAEESAVLRAALRQAEHAISLVYASLGRPAQMSGMPGDILDVSATAQSRAGPANPTVSRVMVFLDRPTRASKRALHAGIFRAFAGAERLAALRKTVAVVPPNGHELIHSFRPELVGETLERVVVDEPSSQFEDDLIFFKDNFQGVGFWPPMLEGQAGYSVVFEHVLRIFASPTMATNVATAGFNQSLSAVCSVVCPNRMFFRALLTVLIIATFIVLLITALWCKFCMEVAERYHLSKFLFGGFFLAFLLLSACDPWIQEEAFILLVVIVLALFGYTIAMGVANAQREEDP